MPDERLVPVRLTCNGARDPVGIDLETGTPRLGWQLEGAGRGRRQTAYRVQVARSEEALASGNTVWDSGRTESDESQHVGYRGPRLRSGQRRVWRVRAWDENGRPGPWSALSSFEMGLLAERDWRGRWIAPVLPAPEGESHEPQPLPAPLLRTTFALSGPVHRARLYVCGLGFHETWINGERVGDDVLDPPFTRYDLRALYTTHDVTPLLHEGPNAVGVMLGGGWFDDDADNPWWFAEAPWRTRPRLRLQLDIELADGTHRTIASDQGWRASSGPVLENGVRTGETYDARLEQPGWSEPVFDDGGWGPVHLVPGPGGRLVARTTPIRVVETLEPVAIHELGPGIHLVDFGRNVAGWVRLRVNGPAGTEVVMRHGERLGPDGDLDQSWIDRFSDPERFQRDVYVLRGGGVETWEPRFTYHGFQYVRVAGFPGTPTPDAFRACVVSSALPAAGRFASDNEMLNRIQSAARASFTSNFVGFPTDCPHREKNGWMDAHLHAELGLYTVDVAPGYRKWLDDIADAQRGDGSLPAIVPSGGWGYSLPPNDDPAGPAWDSGCIHLPWTLYRFSGDVGVLRRHYPVMTRYLAHLATMATGGIVDQGIGDWCPPGGQEVHQTPIALTSTAFFHADAVIVARVAGLLGRDRDARRYAMLAARIRRAFNRAFYDPGTGWYAGREMTAQAAALANGLVEDGQRDRVVARLLDAVAQADERAAFGILGARWVPQVLADHGHADAALRIATQETFPGWGHWIAQGATTLWERWEGIDSRNHTMFGDIGAWMVRTLAGLSPDPERPGFRRILVHPHCPPGLDWAEAELDSPYGRVRCAWRRRGDGLELDVDVPPNADAQVSMPCPDGAVVRESGSALEDAVGVQRVGAEAGRLRVDLGSGRYRFAIAN